MTGGNRLAMGRLSHVLVALSFAATAAGAAGCAGGGGGGGGPTPVTTLNPGGGTQTSSPTNAPATSPPEGVPSPISTTVGSSQTVTTRPLASGDSYVFGGQLLTSFVYYGSNPSPSSTSLATVTQNVKLSGPTTQNGVSGLTDVDTVETDASALATKTITTDAYEAIGAASAGQELGISSSSSTTSDGYTIGITYPSPYVLDLLPETSGASFSNSPAQSISETEPGGFSSTRQYASDGTYSDTETYPSDAADGGGAAPNATIIEYHSGNGVLSLPLQGSEGNTVITVGTPSPVSTTGPSTILLSLQVPDPTVSPETESVPVWYAQPLALYTESNLQTGSKPLPGPCNVPSSLATSANALVTEIQRVDTVLGVDETSSQISYVAPMIGLVCVQLTDISKSYYDYTGEGEDGVAVSGTTTPLEIDTVQETLGLQTVNASNAVVRAGGISPNALRGGTARGAFDLAVARARDLRMRRAIDALRLKAGRAAR